MSQPNSHLHSPPRSMRLARHGRAAAADQEVEIDALIRLHDMIDIKLGVAADMGRLESLPFPAPALALARGDVEMEPPFLDVDLDHVAILDQAERPARPGLARR